MNDITQLQSNFKINNYFTVYYEFSGENIILGFKHPKKSWFSLGIGKKTMTNCDMITINIGSDGIPIVKD
jgi:hypothetical protein